MRNLLVDFVKRRIDFLIIGTQKGGTSALNYYLGQHPDIGMGEKKELHFFDRDKMLRRGQINYWWYHSKFNFSAQKKVYGEATPIYLYWEPSCKRIWKYNKNIKLIAILRNPIERAFSHWNMELDRKWDTENFMNCIKNEAIRIKEALPHQHRVYSYVERGFYSEQIRRYQRFFKKEQLMFLKYEDFKINQERDLNKVFEFLGVSSQHFTFERKEVHKREYRTKISDEERELLFNIYKYDIKEVERLLGWNCDDWK